MRNSSTFAAMILFLISSSSFAANLLQNGDVEQGKGDQPSIWLEAQVPAKELKMVRETTQAHGGKASLYIENQHKYDQPVANNWAQTLQTIPKGKVLTVVAFVKTADVDSANVCLQCWDASGNNMLAFVSTPVVRGDQDWTSMSSQSVVVPAETKSITVRCALAGTGKVWFDDIVVTESDAETTAAAEDTAAAHAVTPADYEKIAHGKVLKVVPVNRDQMVLAYLPDWNYGRVDNIAVANNDGGVRTMFSWPGFAKVKTPCRCVLAVYSRKTTGKTDPGEIEAHAVLANWSEQTNWKNAPRSGEQPANTYKFEPGEGWKTFDVTPIITAKSATNGVLLRFAKEDKKSNDWSGYEFVSREGDGQWKTHHPVLLIVEAQ